jgi:hypothetical protein
MDPARQPESSLSPSHARSTSWLGRWQRLSPLARDIAIVLVVKAVVLCAIWFAFFRMPVARHMTMDPRAVEQQVAGPGAHPEPAHAVR